MDSQATFRMFWRELVFKDKVVEERVALQWTTRVSRRCKGVVVSWVETEKVNTQEVLDELVLEPCLESPKSKKTTKTWILTNLKSKLKDLKH